MHDKFSKRQPWKRWLFTALAVILLVPGLPLQPASIARASGAATAAADPNKVYVSFKNATFDANNPLVGDHLVTTVNSSPGGGLSQLGSITAAGLQYNFGRSTGSYANPQDIVGFQDDRIRLATTIPYSFGSIFNKERVTLSDNRSFSTYFGFKMHAGSQADGIVFVVQTASNEAGAAGGGLGYSGVGKSFGIEYDTYYNNPQDQGTARNDPRPVNLNSGNRASHVALDLNGDVGHGGLNSPNYDWGKNIATLDTKKMSLAQTDAEAVLDPYKQFHSWIDYNGLTQKFEVYLIRENNDGSFWAPMVNSNGTLQTSGSGTSAQIDTVKLTQFPHLANGVLVAPKDGGGTQIIKPILSDTVDLGSKLLQDDAYIGFTAATGGANQHHDITSWYFNNFSGLIAPRADTQPTIEQAVELAPTQVQILNKVPLVADGINYDFAKYEGVASQPYGYEPITGVGAPPSGIVADGSKAEIKAEIRTINDELIAGYPVTFSLYYVDSYSPVNIGSGREAVAAKQKDDEKVYLTAEGYTVRTRTFERDGTPLVVREITVPTDKNGVAAVNVWNLGNYPHLTNVKARIGGELSLLTYGGGNSDSAPVLFAAAKAPKVEEADVGPDRHTVVVKLDQPVTYDPKLPGGFAVDVGTEGNPVKVPLEVIGHGKDAYGQDDPFTLILEIDPGHPDYPPQLPTDYVILPQNVNPPLSYDKTKGTVAGTGTGSQPLDSFPNGDTSVNVGNRFAPEHLAVVNDQERRTIQVTFPEAINALAPHAAETLKAFTLAVNGEPVNPAGLVFDPSDPAVLLLTVADAIPPNASVALTYDPSALSSAERITNSHSAPLDKFVNDPVENQMAPDTAVVINDLSRDKVRVVFNKPLDPAIVTGAVYQQFTFDINGVAGPVLVTRMELLPDGKTLVFALNADQLPAGGIPVLADGASGTNISLNYQVPAALANIRESGADARGLSWLKSFPVENQLMFNPAAAAVDTLDRNQVKVRFPTAVSVEGTPQFTVAIGSMTVPATVTGVTYDTSILTLKLPGGVLAEPEAKLAFGFSPYGGNVVDAGDPQRVLATQIQFPVDNIHVGIQPVAGGSPRYQPVTVLTGTSEPGSQVSVVVKNSGNSTLLGSLETDPLTGAWTWTADSPISLSDTYTVAATAEKPGLLPLSTTATASFVIDHTIPHGGGLTVTANPLHNVGDGETTTTLTASVTDENGQPVPGVLVKFATSGTGGGSFVDKDGNPVTQAATDANGAAVIYYRSPDLAGGDAEEIAVEASVVDPQKGISAYESFTIHFEPPAIRGSITETDRNGQLYPVAGKALTIKNGAGQVVGTAVTDADGKYEFKIPFSRDTYTIEYTKDLGQGRSVVYSQHAATDKPFKGDGTDALVSNKAVAGIVGTKSADGQVQAIDIAASKAENPAVAPEFVVFLKQNGQYVDGSNTAGGAALGSAAEADGFPVGANGLFIADGLPQGGTSADNTYELEIRYYYNQLDSEGNPTGVRQYVVINEKRNGQLPAVSVNNAGELNISEELIDPYGTISNSQTGALIDDREVTLKLWYANTARNKANGVTPDTPVALPSLPGFPPADNDSPVQKVTGGSYAWMVYGDSDYYITANANGYDTYDSRYDSRTVAGTAKENGLHYIKVENAIVRFDFAMAPSSDSGEGTAPTATPKPGVSTPSPAPTATPAPGQASDIAVNVTVSRSVQAQASEASIDVLYKNNAAGDIAEGQIRVTLPEGAEVIDADGGTVLAGMIVWDIRNLKAGDKGTFTITVKWPELGQGEQERIMTVKGESAGKSGSPSGEAASAKLLVYSNQAGNLKHQRYVLGYPDGTFQEGRFLTRAELAAIIARLIGDYDAPAKGYTDVPATHWAYGYINTATAHKIFEGDLQGTFRPEDPVSRGELAAVMTRYLQLETGVPVELHYADVPNGYWAVEEIEALYRNGMIEGYPDGTFKPVEGITRSGAVTMINRMLYRGPLTEVEQTWPDVPPGFWAFGQIEEASVSHESYRAEVDGKTVEVLVRKLDDQVK
ncbi:S-layer homology domain-containing protein [Paenibacillus sp. YN15]|uniref:S-layer homology domain-containing protein n=1 Tax=Paenibacillus sp. YN15 TaxID=1742774 RepID=UPI0015ECBAE6|nr:S-layer homology domain-containing protein [Paenibacillus sp. YN15]